MFKIKRTWTFKLFVSSVVVALLLSAFLVALAAYTVLVSTKKRVASYSQACSQQLELWMQKNFNEISIYKSQMEYDKLNKDNLELYLPVTHALHDAFPAGIFVGNEKGYYVDGAGWKPDEGFSVTERPWFVSAMKSDGFSITEPYVDAYLNKPCFSISARIKADGPAAVIGGDVYCDYVGELLKSSIDTSFIDGVLVITQENNLIVADTRFKLSGEPFFDGNEFEEGHKWLDSVSGKEMTSVKWKGKTVFIISTPMDEFGWYLVTYVGLKTILLPFKNLIITDCLIIFLFVVSIIVLARKLLTSFTAVRELSTDRKKINESIADSYIVLGYCDLVEQSYREIKSDPYVLRGIGGNAHLQTCIYSILRSLADDDYIKNATAFANCETLGQRLESKRSISYEFFGKYYGYCRASFFPVEYDSDGNLAKALYGVEKIEGEILSLRDRLKVEETLIECVRALNMSDDYDNSINELLEIIGKYHGADRAHIIDFDFSTNTFSTSYEWVREGAVPHKDKYQNIDVGLFRRWYDIFISHKTLRVHDVSILKGLYPAEYEMLSSSDIRNLIAVPLFEGKEFMGFLGVSNPSVNTETNILLESVSSFIVEVHTKMKYMKELYSLSYCDNMTGCMNRHAYVEEINRMERDRETNVGVVFADINGLKKTNDSKGHEAGDQLITNCSALLKTVFSREDDSIFRIGGDEFVIFRRYITRSEFDKGNLMFQQILDESPILSCGETWIELCENVEEKIKDADAMMYRRKSEFYIKSGYDRRSR